MKEMIVWMQQNTEILAMAAGGLLVVMLFGFLARIVKQIKRLNISLKSITQNIQNYMDVILKEETKETKEAEPERVTLTREEKEMLLSNDGRKKEEEEQIVNAVLQEYFS
ncbi:MAG: hypothetical protein RR139_09935 [Lachnospiraceae bacterium]